MMEWAEAELGACDLTASKKANATPAPPKEPAVPPAAASVPGNRTRSASSFNPPPSPTAGWIAGAGRRRSTRHAGRRSVSESSSLSLGGELIGSHGPRAWARTLDTAWQKGAAGGQ